MEMAKKSIITWISIVSGLVTILLIFENPFQDKARLFAYVEGQDIVSYDKELVFNCDTYNNCNRKDVGLKNKIDEKSIVKVSLKNEGEIKANRVHVKFTGYYDTAIVKKGSEFEEYEREIPIYIDYLEADGVVDIYYLDSGPFVGLWFIEDKLSISSPDSGKARLRSDIKGEGIVWYFEKYYFFVVSLIFILFYIVYLLLDERHKYNMNVYDGVNKSVPDSIGNNNPSEDDFEKKLVKLSKAWELGIVSEEEYKSKGKEILEKSIDDEV